MGEAATLQPPLALGLPTQLPPLEIGRRAVAVFDFVARLPGKVQWTQRHTAAALGADRDRSLEAAATSIAAAIDARPDFYDRLPYHNRQHFCEVMLIASLLCQAHRVSTKDSQLLLLAALVHDLDHDGRPGQPFRLERASLQGAEPYLERAKVGPDARQRLAALVLATEPSQGVTSALEAQRHHAEGAALRPAPKAAPELAQLALHADLAAQAVLLCEADLLPSIGLTLAHGVRLQDQLSQEWGRPLSLSDKLRFVDGILDRGVVGTLFTPNVLAIRSALRVKVDEPRSR
jgi:hypothetical protein